MLDPIMELIGETGRAALFRTGHAPFSEPLQVGELIAAPGRGARVVFGPHQAARRRKLKFFVPNEPCCLPPSSDSHTGPQAYSSWRRTQV